MSYKAALFALVLAAACALVVVAQLPPWVMLALLGLAALVRAVAAFRREQHKMDRILLEELGPADDDIEAPVGISSRPSRPSVSGLVLASRRLHRAS